MFRSRFSFVRSVLGALAALLLLGTLGLAPAGAVPVRAQLTPGLLGAVSLPASPALPREPVEPAPTEFFADVAADHDFSEEISWLAQVGVSTGWSGPGGTRLFRPYEPVLRDQMVAVLHRLDPLLPGRDTPVAEVVSGYVAAYAIRADGTVWAWGWNQYGRLGNGTTTASSVTVRVTGLPEIRDLEAIYVYASALAADGTVWGWGWNSDGQLGNGTTTNSSVPVQMSRIHG
jgi:YD repeat-containing protein